MTNEYLSGNSFSTAYKFKFTSDWPLTDRFKAFERMFTDMNVIHVGCVDHMPVIDQKIKTGRWVHGRICQLAKRCIGFDINEKGISYLRTKHNVDDVFAFDVCGGVHQNALDTDWDYLFVSEVLEHVDNPVDFLARIRSNWGDRVKKLVITVPNAFRYENFVYSRSGYELINSDHRYWFTPFTVSKVASQGGFQNPQVHFVTSAPLPNSFRPKQLLHRRKLSLNPAFRDTLLLEANF